MDHVISCIVIYMKFLTCYHQKHCISSHGVIAQTVTMVICMSKLLPKYLVAYQILIESVTNLIIFLSSKCFSGEVLLVNGMIWNEVY